MRDPGGGGEPRHLKVDIKDAAEEGIAFRGHVPLGFLEQAAERDRGRSLAGTGLAEAALCAGDEVGADADLTR